MVEFVVFQPDVHCAARIIHVGEIANRIVGVKRDEFDRGEAVGEAAVLDREALNVGS